MNATPSAAPKAVTPATRPSIGKVAAVVNSLAHSVGPADADALAEIVAGFGLALDLVNPQPHELDTAIETALRGSPDLLVVLAGDGTAREAARFCGPGGPLLAILPGGTLNVLSHALYGVTPWRDTLASILETGIERPLSGGVIAGRPFYTAAILGSPALWAPVREALRRTDFATAWKRGRSALSRAFAGQLRYESDQLPPCRTTGLGLICPVVSRAFDDHEPALEAALLDQRDITEVLRLGLYHLLGDWRADPKVATTPCRRGRVWARRRIPATLDGESFLMERSVDIVFIPKACRVLVPPTKA